MLILCAVLLLLPNSVQVHNVDEFMEKLQNKRIHEAELILRNVTDINALYEMSLRLLTLKNPLIELMFFGKIIDGNHNWHQGLEIAQDVQLWQALSSNLDLLQFERMQMFLTSLENGMGQKSAEQLKLLLLHKDLKGFDILTQQLSPLSLQFLFRTLRLSLAQTYGLISHSKLLKRLNLFGNLNEAKVVYFIVFFKQLKEQKALSPTLTYKLALSLRHLMDSQLEQAIHLHLTNLKQALPSPIVVLVFSKKLCLSNRELWYLNSLKDNPFSLSVAATDSSCFASYTLENKLILKAKSSNLEIFINYSHNLNDNLNDYHLKPAAATAHAYILFNARTNQMLCLKSGKTVWLNTLRSDNINCLWTLNNCTSLKRFLANEI